MFCPLSGKICFNQKTNLAYDIVPMFVCDTCTKQVWQDYMQVVFGMTGVDKILSAGELNYAISAIKTKEELYSFLSEISTKFSQPPCICGTELRTLMETGRPGCSNCYTHFRDFMRALVQGENCHVGKRPKDINVLKREMDLAVKEERYEDAAKLRDQIRSLIA